MTWMSLQAGALVYLVNSWLTRLSSSFQYSTYSRTYFPIFGFYDVSKNSTLGLIEQ